MKYLIQGLLPVLVVLGYFILVNFSTPSVGTASYTDKRPLHFKVSSRIKIIIGGVILFFFVLTLISLFQEAGVRILFASFFFFFTCFGILAYIQLKKTEVVITEEYLQYKQWGKIKKQIALNKIQDVDISDGSFIIDTGEKYKTVFPAYFENVSLLMTVLGKYKNITLSLSS